MFDWASYYVIVVPGATATTALTHIVIQERLDGKAVDWSDALLRNSGV
jgi:hypothetical protein